MKKDHPFDSLASDYDATFTHSLLGTLMRQVVWRRLEARFGPEDRVLELNCGTGEDAVFLARRGVNVLATDASSAMVEIARAKATQTGLADRVQVRCLAVEEIARSLRKHLEEDAASSWLCFDGALSNFGGLNCVEDLGEVAAGLAACLRPGGVAVLCLMGPRTPWEWAWYLWRGKPARAFRRLKPGGSPWRGLTIRYPSIRAVQRAFAPAFCLRRATAIGALLPPTYAEDWALRHAWTIAHLNRWERRLETLPPLPALADHYLLELERL